VDAVRVLFDIGPADMRAINEFFMKYEAGMRETQFMMSVLDRYAGGPGRSGNLHLIRHSWMEAERRASKASSQAFTRTVARARAKHGADSERARELTRRAEKRRLEYQTVQRIMGLDDGRILVWLHTDEWWARKIRPGRPMPWEVERATIEMLDKAESITRYYSEEAA
jgi:hypothetical protein